MSIAAAPDYLLRHGIETASPAQRFGLLLPIWTTREDQEKTVNKRAEAKSREGDEVRELLTTQGMDAAIRFLRQKNQNRLPGIWEKNDDAAREAWKKITRLAEQDVRCMKKLAERQNALRGSVGEEQLLHLEAESTAPFATGLGNEHPLENGFAFLNPYGLPYLPGSGVKGVVRRAAQELASGEWGECRGWQTSEDYSIRIDKQTLPLSMIDVLFGREPPNGDQRQVRGALSFWDVIPQLKGERLEVEIMTPHQSHYYQNGDAPHESGQPNPICFLTVPPKSGFAFHVVCDLGRLNRLAPGLAQDSLWKALVEAAFAHAFEWLGFGAKTAVGYGAMKSKASSPAKIAGEEVWENALVKYDVSTRAMTAALGERKASKPEAKAVFDGLGSKSRQDKAKSGQLKARATVRIAGETLELLAID